MPDRRRHRGPAPQDAALFAPAVWPALRQAVGHLSWLLTRGYADDSARKLVGDRFALVARQRLAVARCACSDAARDRRRETAVAAGDLRGRPLWIDGYNLLITVEAALAGGVVLIGRDGACRDLASMHGSFRRVAETEGALLAILDELRQLDPAGIVCLLDQPVANSGRLRAHIAALAEAAGLPMDVRLARDPDRLLVAAEGVVASSDSAVMDRCQSQFGLAGWTVRRRAPSAWIVDLSLPAADASAPA